MAYAKTLFVEWHGRSLELSFQKYQSGHIAAPVFPATEIYRDKLVLPNGRTLVAFKDAVRATAVPSEKGGIPLATIAALQNQASQREFGKSLDAVINEMKEALQLRYLAAHGQLNGPNQAEELLACARQGHVQANFDLGVQLKKLGKAECADFFAEAHNLGHPSSLLELSKCFFSEKNVGAAVRILLLGTWCGSFLCAQGLFALRDHRLSIFEVPACLEVLEEASAYGSMPAKYFLGYVLRHGERCRDVERGSALIREAAAVPHPRKDNGKVPLVEGNNRFHAGTLAHFEQLIDDELLAIRSKESKLQLKEQLATLHGSSKQQMREAFQEMLNRYNPLTERMERRMVNSVTAWFEASKSEPVDEKKRAWMRANLAVQDGELLEPGHD